MSEISLAGVVDLHVHTSPDVQPRRVDDFSLARDAARAGMRAVLIKSHHTLTADRAALVEKIVPGIRVFGGLALNDAVGGLNPAAVQAALEFGAREIWMPTISAAHRAGDKGINVLDDSGKLRQVVHAILHLIAERDVILGTGHLSVAEILQLVPAARAARVKRIVITHPDSHVVTMPLETQLQLRDDGVFFERCFLATVPHTQQAVIPIATIAHAIRHVGVASTILASDCGRVGAPAPLEAMREFIAGLSGCGITPNEIDRMAKQNPCWLLDLKGNE